MRKSAKIVSLASALAALATPAATPQVAHAADSDNAEPSVENGDIHAKPEIKIPVGTELMSFTVHQISDNLMFPQHGSHSSHSSHASHASSSPGYGGVPDYVPNLPSAPYVPYDPAPIYAPPVVQPPESSTSPPPTATATDPKYVACTGAINGLGVNDIVSQLEQLFGMSQNDATNMATQALTAVLAGGHYCDAYLGDHG
jgi:hypothetical protein